MWLVIATCGLSIADSISTTLLDVLSELVATIVTSYRIVNGYHCDQCGCVVGATVTRIAVWWVPL